MHRTHPYDALTPDLVLDAVEAAGHAVDGRLAPLNSFENRVYQVGIDGGRFVIAKFYRPQRWSDAQILDEHRYTIELAAAELPVVAPLSTDGCSLLDHAGFRYALYPRVGGRPPELEGSEHAAWMGRLIGRMHAIGRRARYAARPALDPRPMLAHAVAAVFASPLLPRETRGHYQRAIDRATPWLFARFDAVGAASLRLHGDCHPGNVLWNDSGPLLVDFDDARSGPAVQDLWMLMHDDPRQREALVEGYTEFCDFDMGELDLIPALRLLRQIHYAGWIAERWDDPAFPRAFPWAAEARWWAEHVADLHSALDD
jgi:Ser/Thr protein kinase RdoA (MazF antagonist)